MARTMLAVMLIASLDAGWAAAQAGPNFSGPWVMDMTRSESAAQAADASPRTPVRLDIKASPASLTIRTLTDGKSETVAYAFEPVTPAAASESTGRGDRTIEQADARWDGPSLITVTVYRVNGMSAKKTETRSLSDNGKEMTVQTEMQMQHGYESDATGPAADANAKPAGYATAKDVYVRESR